MANKICFFIGSMYGGGAERVISILANHYRKIGWDVDIAVLLDARVGYELEKDIRIIDLSQNDGSYYKRLPQWLVSIRKYVKKEKPDRIVSFVGRINVLVLTACFGKNVPIIVSERNDPMHDGRGFIMLKVCNMLYKKAQKVVFQTQYQKSCFTNRLKNGVIIPNPVFVNVEPKETERPYELVTAGRLSPQKNQKMLIDAVSFIHNDQLKLKIYGEGELHEELQNRIIDKNINAILCGNIKDLHAQINGAGIFVMCSDFEGLSNALIEAMMLGLVCISTNYPGANEIIEDGKNGLIVPRNEPKQLAKVIEKVLEDDNLRNSLSHGALVSSEKYKKEQVIKMWEAII